MVRNVSLRVFPLGTSVAFPQQRCGLQGRRLESPEEDWYARHYVAYTSPLNSSAAEGNPDEQKIGAFGVGKQRRVIFEHVEMLMQTNRFLQVSIRLEIDTRTY